MSCLWGDEFPDRESDGLFRTWQTEHELSLCDERNGPGQLRRASNLLVTQHAEELPETGESLLLEMGYGLQGHISLGDPCPAVDDHNLYAGVFYELSQLPLNTINDVPDDTLLHQSMSRCRHDFGDCFPRDVVSLGAGVSDRNDCV